MTTIAVNRTSIACDLQFTHASGMKFKGKTKLLEVPIKVADGIFGHPKTVIGFCGSGDTWGDVVNYLILGEGKRPRCKDIEFLMLQGDGKFYHGTNLSNWIQIDTPYFAIGSGMQYAVAAMDTGKTPIEAVKVAAKYDSMTGMGYKQVLV